MNYRHAYHAGNHADVLKHVLLTRVLAYMTQKDKPFAVLDAHAGVGRYDLLAPEAFKTGEWRDGIAKLVAVETPAELADLMQPFRSVLAACNPDGRLLIYPGSPEIILAALRPGDRLIANELHPQDAAALAGAYAHHPQLRVTNVDALQAVKAELPFREKRGIVLIDPAFEVADENARVLRMVEQILHRMANTVILVWYPLKGREEAASFVDAFKSLDANGILACELYVREAFKEGGLAGSGMIAVNPPHVLHNEMQRLLPFLVSALGVGKWGRGRLNWIRPPR